MIERAVYEAGVEFFMKKAGFFAKPKQAAQVIEELKGPVNKMANGEMIHHGLELAGLGTLAAPSVAHLAGHDMDESTKSKLEIGGLGVLGGVEGHGLYKALKRRI